MTASDLQDLLTATLLRHYGGSRRRWKTVLGPVRVYDPATHAHCNWSAAPSGSVAEVAAIEALLDRVRGEHPIVSEG
ncbi:hypothetical protein [Sphingomonas sp. S2-65]|uniref:hypothetical protein n=1 Tax=Sphingomonas sp. S2-65 TaxID=2903960 RepID=UPI001F365778|nr:hypothetical protein [Sphingomonas sp. S2-65]UYY59474.1 hypothetical protein LZ586_05140 [Sphingomonas sp. S2-65]